MSVSCSFCPRKFDTLQQLGGHQTRHREEMNALRRKHEEQMKMERENKSRRHEEPLNMGCDKNRSRIVMEVIAPNPAFWETYHKYGIEPKVVEFIPVSKNGGELAETTNCSSTTQEVDLALTL